MWWHRGVHPDSLSFQCNTAGFIIALTFYLHPFLVRLVSRNISYSHTPKLFIHDWTAHTNSCFRWVPVRRLQVDRLRFFAVLFVLRADFVTDGQLEYCVLRVLEIVVFTMCFASCVFGSLYFRFMGSQRVGHDWATELNWTSISVFRQSHPTPHRAWHVSKWHGRVYSKKSGFTFCCRLPPPL